MRYLSILFTVSIILLSRQVKAQSGNLSFERVQDSIELEKDYTYETFDASSDYLAWIEFYKAEIFVRDLSTGDTKIIQLNEGRGPGEYIAISDLAIKDDNIYVSDPRNNKLIQIDIASEEKKDLPFREKRVFRFTSHQNRFFLLEHVRPDVLIRLYHPDKKQVYPLNKDELDLQEEFDNPFFKDGYISAQKDEILLVTRFRPHIYVYSEEKSELSKKIVFDDSEVQGMETQENDEGVKAMYPPTEVDILIECALLLDQKPNSIFILAKGESDNRSYSLDQLFEYNYKKEEFVATYDLGIKSSEVVANKDHLFLFSEDEFTIYKFKIEGVD